MTEIICGVLLILGVLLPAGFWAIRQDQLVRTETGHLSAKAENTQVEAGIPTKFSPRLRAPSCRWNWTLVTP